MNDQNANDGRKVEMLFGQLQCRPQMKPRARVTCGKPTSLAPGVGLAQFSKCTVHTSALHLAGSPTGDSYAFRTTQTPCMLEGQPPVQYEHEVVTGDGEVDTLLQATR